MSAPLDPGTPPPNWLIRVPSVFEPWMESILNGLDLRPMKVLGREFHLVKPGDPQRIRSGEASVFLRWNLPLHHVWPCSPLQMEDFESRAADGLLRKFGGLDIAALQAGVLDPGSPHPHFRHLATRLRGQLERVWPALRGSGGNEDPDPDAPTLFCMVGREGLFAGRCTPREANGFHAGGTRFIRQNHPDAISRAGAKIAEALHDLLLHRRQVPEGGRWLELGASPGGMTSELLQRGFHVTAIDRAPLDARLDRAPNLVFHRCAAADARISRGHPFDALLCDMNGDPRESMNQVCRLAEYLHSGATIVFTLKLPGIDRADEALKLLRDVTGQAERSGLHLIGRTHGSYNRREFTLFLGKS